MIACAFPLTAQKPFYALVEYTGRDSLLLISRRARGEAQRRAIHAGRADVGEDQEPRLQPPSRPVRGEPVLPEDPSKPNRD
jgi:hypothetical protein